MRRVMWWMSSLALLGCVEPASSDDPPAFEGWGDAPGPVTAPPRVTLDAVRVVAWNVESVGVLGGPSFLAAERILRRLDAELVCLNEVDDYELDELALLAGALGYETVLVPLDNPFGGLRNALLSRLPAVASAMPTAQVLSDDGQANDVTRTPVAIEVALAEGEGAGTLSLTCQHFKSGFDADDVFRRTVDVARTGQASALLSADVALIAGDFNAQLGDAFEPGALTETPWGLPSSYRLGSDLALQLQDVGLTHSPFRELGNRGFEVIDAVQRDGDPATRPVSGRRIDYIAIQNTVVAYEALAEVYDPLDEGLEGLPMSGDAPPATDGALASDHLPVVVDLMFR